MVLQPRSQLREEERVNAGTQVTGTLESVTTAESIETTFSAKPHFPVGN